MPKTKCVYEQFREMKRC